MTILKRDNVEGKRIYKLCEKLFPICRSITGSGVRKTLSIIDDYISDTGNRLNIYEIPTGTQVFDWTIPKEWNIREAYIEDVDHNRIIDFAENNLHVMGYSVPVDEWVDLPTLLEHVYTQPEQPEVIPYVTSYYLERYGFCMSDHMKKSLKHGSYHMFIDSELSEGSLTLADLVVHGNSEEEILFTTYICHPSMANNECSGPSLMAELIRFVSSLNNRRYSYRFVYEPETIGAITYISKNLDCLKKNVIAAFNLTCVGDKYGYSITETPNANSLSDNVLRNAIRNLSGAKIYSYIDRNSDERQYCAPGVDIPMVCFSKSKPGEYVQYHTSADNMQFVSPTGFQESFDIMKSVITALEWNYIYRSTTVCEPQLGRRGLTSTISQKGIYGDSLIIRHIFAFSDGKRDLIDIADIIGVPVINLIETVERMCSSGILKISNSKQEDLK